MAWTVTGESCEMRRVAEGRGPEAGARAGPGAWRRTARVLTLSLVLSTVSACAMAQSPPNQGPGGDTGVERPDARTAGAALPTEADLPEAEEHRGYPALPASEMAGAVLEDLESSPDGIRARVGGERLEMTAGSPFYRLGDRTYQMANFPYWRDGEFWIPREVMTGALHAARSAGERDGRRAAEAGEPRTWRLVVDPGHGGRDPGTTGMRGTREKDVVLAVARKLRERLAEAEHVEVMMTRESDEFVPLGERSQMAASRGADLFLSIHANAAPDRRARGFETYFLGEARTEEAKRVAMRENAALRFEDRDTPDMDDLAMILASLDLRQYQQESSVVAGHVQNRFRQRISAPDRGVKQNIFYVLVGASGSMPAVLTEIGFLSNPEEERFLRSQQGQAAIADALADAVLSYFEDRERREYGTDPGRRTATR